MVCTGEVCRRPSGHSHPDPALLAESARRNEHLILLFKKTQWVSNGPGPRPGASVRIKRGKSSGTPRTAPSAPETVFWKAGVGSSYCDDIKEGFHFFF